MNYQVLARKWRPRKFDEIIGQKHIVQAVKNSLKNSRVAQAYLLTGLRGVGKTTIARIFAKSAMCLNLQPDMNACEMCSSCKSINDGSSLDFIEIDGATNNGVENVRQLIENAQYLPVNSKYKVYVVDEVHMLSVSAFNALLKTLEEPPKHVIFIFATTDPQKLLGTVLSRCQRFDLRSLSDSELEEQITKIAKLENINFENNKIIKMLVKQGNGSVRDTLSLLDQAIGLAENNFITEVVLSHSLGLASTGSITKIVESMLIGDTSLLSSIYRKLIQENVDIKKLTNQVIDTFFQIIDSVDEGFNKSDVDIKILSAASISELIWIYEVLIKDSDWALKSIMPAEAVEIIFKKIALRRKILANIDSPIDLKKKIDLKDKPLSKEETLKSWDDFLKYAFEKNPAVAANLEHGNVISLTRNNESLKIEFGFKNQNKLFYDYLQDKDIYNLVLITACEYFECKINNFEFDMKLLNDENTHTMNFKSKSEVISEEIVKLQESKKENIQNNKFIKDAQEIFLSKVDKIIID